MKKNYVIFKLLEKGCVCGKTTYCNNHLLSSGCKFGEIEVDNVIIDFSKKRFIDSGFCKNIITGVIQKNKKLYLIKCEGQPRNVLQVLNLGDYIIYCDSIDEVLSHIEKTTTENKT